MHHGSLNFHLIKGHKSIKKFVCVCHSSFVYARGQCASRYTFLFPFVYNGVNNKWYVYIVFTFVSKWITFSRKDNLSVKVILMFLYKIYANVSFGTRSYTHTHTHTHTNTYIGASVHEIFQARILEWAAIFHFLLQGIFLIQ